MAILLIWITFEYQDIRAFYDVQNHWLIKTV